MFGKALFFFSSSSFSSSSKKRKFFHFPASEEGEGRGMKTLWESGHKLQQVLPLSDTASSPSSSYRIYFLCVCVCAEVGRTGDVFFSLRFCPTSFFPPSPLLQTCAAANSIEFFGQRVEKLEVCEPEEEEKRLASFFFVVGKDRSFLSCSSPE